jgi:hypothetical protein
MWNFAMTFPTFATVGSEMVEAERFRKHFIVGDELIVATDTILLYNFGTSLFYHNYLGF